MSNNLRTYRLLIFSILLFAAGIASEYLIPYYHAQNNWVGKRINKVLAQTLPEQEHLLENIAVKPSMWSFDSFNIASSQHTYEILIYKHDSLKFWSTNAIDFDPWHLRPDITVSYVETKSGVYRVCARSVDEFEVFTFFLIYDKYVNPNGYFIPGFNKPFDLGNSVTISFYPQHPVNVPVISEGRTIFYVSTPDHLYRGYVPHFLYIACAIMFISFLFRFSMFMGHLRWKVIATGILFLILIIAEFTCFGIAFFDISSTKLFSPEVAALSPILSSLGQLIGYVLMAVCLLQMFKWWVVEYFDLTIDPKSRRGMIAANIIIALLIYIANAYIFIRLVKLLILNSRINFDFNDISAIDIYTVIAMLSLFSLFLLLALLYRIVSKLISHVDKLKMFMPLSVLVFLTGDLILFFYGDVNGFLLITMSLMALSHMFLLVFPRSITIRQFIIAVVLLAGFLAIGFNQLIVTKENEYRKLFANKILNNQDFENETHLADAEDKLIEGNAINQYFYWNKANHNEFEANLNYNYFGRYLKNFNIEWMRYDSCGSDITPNPISYNDINNLYNSANHRSISNYFLFIKDASYLGGYVAKYEICPDKKVYGHVFILMKPKIKSDEYFFEDFFDKNDDRQQQYNEYSYALYVDNDLVKGLGSFPFKLNKTSNLKNLPDKTFYEEDGYSHLVDRIDQHTILLVSKKARGFRQNFHIFSFLLLFYLLLLGVWFTLLYLCSGLLYLLPSSITARRLRSLLHSNFNLANFNSLFLGAKIRLALFLLVIFCFGGIIYFTLNEVNRTFNDRQDAELDKKMALIINELESDFNTNEALLLKHLSNNYEVDINIFNTDGHLVETTSDKVYEDGLLNDVMQPVAFYELGHNNKFTFKQTETIGNLKYESMYNALFDGKRNVIGYVNLPYFLKSFDLNNEFSKYLGSLLNVFTLLLLLTFLIGTAISKTLTDPLKLIIKRIAQFKLGGQNKPIQWQQNDEIGQLVAQYNLMVKELEESTEKLAKSEREGAWREMAKQVAHEIKNPLTPMKLNIQFLQMAWARKDPGIDETFKNVSTVLINQIDALSNMAEAFSSFAKMPEAKLERCNLSDLIAETVNLFEQQPDFDIKLNNTYRHLNVMVDKVQLQRVFTNIIKNAHQAGVEGRDKRVEITVAVENRMAVIAFKDNGCGVPEELKEKIFSPNFSTKTSGMGLGLAMSKKIIENISGRIWFESEAGEGTTFFVSIPLV